MFFYAHSGLRYLVLLVGVLTLGYACYGAVGLLVVPLSGILASLETDSLIKLQGTAVLRDDDDDLIVDRITPGEWAGVVLIEGAAGSPFDGTWEAHRQTP